MLILSPFPFNQKPKTAGTLKDTHSDKLWYKAYISDQVMLYSLKSPKNKQNKNTGNTGCLKPSKPSKMVQSDTPD